MPRIKKSLRNYSLVIVQAIKFLEDDSIFVFITFPPIPNVSQNVLV